MTPTRRAGIGPGIGWTRECVGSVFEIANGHLDLKTTGMKDMKYAVMNAISDIQKRHDRPGTLTGLSTGFKALDSLTGGLHGGELFVIAGCPSAGKTALAMNMAEDIAVNGGQSVGFFSLGMNRQQLVPRFLDRKSTRLNSSHRT